MANNRSVLFVCTYNDGRFQMAAGYLNHLAGGLIEVRSAEPPPADSIDPVVVEAMLEENILDGSIAGSNSAHWKGAVNHLIRKGYQASSV